MDSSQDLWDDIDFESLLSVEDVFSNDLSSAIGSLDSFDSTSLASTLSSLIPSMPDLPQHCESSTETSEQPPKAVGDLLYFIFLLTFSASTLQEGDRV